MAGTVSSGSLTVAKKIKISPLIEAILEVGGIIYKQENIR